MKDELILLEVSIDKEDEMYEDLINDLEYHLPRIKGSKGNYQDGKKHFSGLVNNDELDRFIFLTEISPWGRGYEYSYIRNNKLIRSN